MRRSTGPVLLAGLAAAAMCAAALASGCVANPPENVFSCERGSDCPNGFLCGPDKLCRRTYDEAPRTVESSAAQKNADAAMSGGGDPGIAGSDRVAMGGAGGSGAAAGGPAAKRADSGNAGAGAADTGGARAPVEPPPAGRSGTEPSAGAERVDAPIAEPNSGPAIAAVDSSCAVAHERACAGHASREPLLCEDGQWHSQPACTENQRCETRMGPAQGTCRAIAAECAGKQPGDICVSGERGACGPDLLEYEAKPCMIYGRCVESAGGASCVCPTSYRLDEQGSCVAIDDCPTAACEPGGRCIDDIDDYTCRCDAGYLTMPHACTPRLRNNADGTVADALLGLSWQKSMSPSALPWEEAKAYCAQLTPGAGWRLPTLDELKSLVDSNYSPMIDPAFFPNTSREPYWTGTVYPEIADTIWMVSFDHGGSSGNSPGAFRNVRCVR